MSDKKKILVVEDDITMQAILKARLEMNGYNPIIAADGKSALEKVKDENPDLMITDLILPGMNGYEVCQKLKSDDKYKKMPIIILSGLDREEAKERGLCSGVNAYFIKPFDLDLVLAKIKLLTE